MPVRTPMVPAAISPTRAVPASIVRPHYVNTSGPADLDDPIVKDAATIERMRVAGRIAAAALVEVGRHVHPGVTTDELDAIGHEFVIIRGVYPSTLGYKGFPKSLCTSVNEVICHGIPDARPLADGDIVKIDITAFIGGGHGDTRGTFSPATRRGEGCAPRHGEAGGARAGRPHARSGWGGHPPRGPSTPKNLQGGVHRALPPPIRI